MRVCRFGWCRERIVTGTLLVVVPGCRIFDVVAARCGVVTPMPMGVASFGLVTVSVIVTTVMLLVVAGVVATVSPVGVVMVMIVMVVLGG